MSVGGARSATAGAFAILVAVAGVTAVQRSLVSATNFGGADEWLLLELTSRGVLGVPYANRPLVLLWHVVAGRLFTGELVAFAASTTAYLAGTGMLTAALVRRLVPCQPLLALLAGTAAAAWAPLDSLRLDTVLITGYAGFTLAAMAAMLLFLESCRRPGLAPLLAGALLGLVATLGVESVVPLLAVAPLALLVDGRPSAAVTRRALAWWGFTALAVIVAAAPLLAGTPSYQLGALGVDVRPFAVAGRLWQLVSMQALPLFAVSLPELLNGTAAAAAVVFATGALVAHRAEAAPPPGRRQLGRLLAFGIVLTLAGHAALALTPRIPSAARTQVLSAPGFAIVFAAVVALATARLNGRARAIASITAGAWLVAVGSGRVAAMQTEWDAGRNAYPAQSASLRSLLQQAPGLRPGTALLLLDDSGTWPYGFTFRHAIRFLYGDEVIGSVADVEPFLYPHAFVGEGLLVEPWPVIRRAWQVQPSLHRWDTIVVAHCGPGGATRILGRWPEGRLPPLPAGARYAPAERLVAAAVPADRRRALGVGRSR